jgi:hypothetical protein
MNKLAWTACCSLWLVWGCGTQHIALVSRGTSAAGVTKVCRPIPPDDNCTDTTTDVPADLNKEGTKQINLPETCGGRIHRIVIQNVSSKTPVAHVECAAKENPIADTRSAAPGR